MTDLTTLEIGDLLKTTHNGEPCWFLVQSIDLNADPLNNTVSGRCLPAAGSGQRHCEPLTISGQVLTVSSTLRHEHNKTTVFNALAGSVGLRAAVALLK